MPDTSEFLAKRLRSEGEKMTEYFASLDNAAWMQTVYTEGSNWSVRNVLAHFVTSEKAFFKLFANVIEGGSGASKDFDVDRYNARQQEKTETLLPKELLIQYQEIRAKIATWVEILDEADLKKEGRHPFLGETTLAEMIKLVYRHNQIHYRDIRKSRN